MEAPADAVIVDGARTGIFWDGAEFIWKVSLYEYRYIPSISKEIRRYKDYECIVMYEERCYIWKETTEMTIKECNLFKKTFGFKSFRRTNNWNGIYVEFTK
jgi:hypothetical protein